MTKKNQVESVCVIGSGVSGLIAIKALTEERCFKKIVCFEARSKDGGLWNYSGNTEENLPIPSLDPTIFVDTTVSPIYSHMETNVPYYCMQFKDDPTAREETKRHSLYLTHKEVSQYLQRFGQQFSDIIRHGSRVTAVEKTKNKWLVSIESNTTLKQEYFDSVIVATGSFNTPFLPEFPGLKEWAVKYPGSVLHSKNYRNPNGFTNKIVVIVGCEASGKDIAEASVSVARKVYGVVRNPEKLAELKKDQTSGINWIGSLKSFDFVSQTIETADAEVPIIEEVDQIVFATGYLRSYPFLAALNSSQFPIITDGIRAHNMFNHLYYTPDPTLIIIGLPRYVLSFVLSEIQAIHAARFLSGRLTLPSVDNRIKWEAERQKVVESERAFHDMKSLQDLYYYEELSGELRRFDSGPSSLQPYEINDSHRLLRKNLFRIRSAFKKYREDTNITARSHKELLAKGYLKFEPL